MSLADLDDVTDTLPSLDRPTRDEWAKLRRDMGRVTAVAWQDAPLLLAYQVEIERQFDTHDVVFVEKSRRTGATYGAAAGAVLRSSSSKRDGGMDTLYMGTSHDMAKEFIDAAAMWARAVENVVATVEETLFDDGSEKGVQALGIHFASGFSIVALSSKPRSLRGRQGFAILDEAAFVDNLGELLKAALAFLIWGGKVLVISTHNGADNVFAQTIADIRAGRLNYGLVRFDLDEALQNGLYERICLVTGKAWSPEAEADWREKLVSDYGEAGEEELYCVPAQGGGAFLPGPLIEARMIDVPILRYAVPPSFFSLPEPRKIGETAAWIEDVLRPVLKATLDPALSSAFGMDVGRYRDLSVINVMQLLRTTVRATRFHVEMERVPFAQQEQVALEILRALPRRIGARVDGSGIGAGIAEYLAVHAGVEPIKITVEWYRVDLPPLKAAFEDDMILVPRDADTLADLRALKMRQGLPMLPALRTKSASGGARHGDAAIAIAMAYGATRSNQLAYDGYVPASDLDDRGDAWLLGDEEQGRSLW